MRTATESDRLGGGRQLPSHVEELLASKVEQLAPLDHAGSGVRAVRYPEWDQEIDDYRLNWCRVVERAAEEGSGDIVAATLSAHGPRSRHFDDSSKVCGSRGCGACRAKPTATSSMWMRRSVCALSGRRERTCRTGSTSGGREKNGCRGCVSGRREWINQPPVGQRPPRDRSGEEGLVLLCEALEAVGDQYALYGYSGQGRGQVDFLVIKDFDDQLGGKAAQRLGGLAPMRQNRDGAAIRHATAKLLAREARTRLLVLINDGRPLDDGYKDEYSLEDTKAALREARQRGCIRFVSRSIRRPMAMSGECTATCSSRSLIISKPCRSDCRGSISGSRRET